MPKTIFPAIVPMLILLSSLFPDQCHSQISVNEVIMGSSPAIELKNNGDSEVNAGDLFLCSFPTYNQIQNLTVLSGSTLMAPGSILVISGHSFNNLDDELGLYSLPSYGNPDNILDYVEWGSTGHQRSTVAQSAGIWNSGDFVAVGTGDGSIEYDGFGDNASDWLYDSNNTQGDENSNVQGCEASAFMLGNTSICEGESASFNVILSGEAPWTFIYSWNGVNQEPIETPDPVYPLVLSNDGEYQLVWVEDAICIGSATGAVNLDVLPPPTASLSGSGEVCGPGPGELELDLTGIAPWTLEYHIDGVPQGQIETSENPYIIIANSEGTYNPVLINDDYCSGTVSGSVDVFFNVVEAGTLSFEGGGTEDMTLCTLDDIDDELFFDVQDDEGGSSALLKVSTDGTIQSISTSSSFIFNETVVQDLSIYNIRYLEGLQGLSESAPLDGLEGCYSLSDPLTVIMSDTEGCPVNLEDWVAQGMVKVYPNPFQDSFTLDLDIDKNKTFSWHITDIQGRLMASGTLNRNQSRFIIPTADFEEGFYLLYPRLGTHTGRAIPLVRTE